MTRVCSGCGLHRCEGQCFDASPSDYPDEPEVIEVRPVYKLSADYLAWCEQLTEVHGDPLKRRRAA